METGGRGAARRVQVVGIDFQTRKLTVRLMPVTTTQILARRARELTCGIECVDWAIGLIEQGYDSRSLRILSGLSAPLNHFEIADLRERVLADLSPPELQVSDPVTAYVRELVATAVAEERPMFRTFHQVAQLAIELGYPRELQAFYNLSFAWEDLQVSEEQWYWDGATRGNIDHIMREEAEAFVARGGD
jgi:hypothetical protein